MGKYMSDYHINIRNSKFDNGSAVIYNQNGGLEYKEQNAIIEELQKIAEHLTRTEPMLANAISELQQAMKEQNKTKVSNLLSQLSTGFAANVLSNLASGALLRFIGIG